MTVRLLAPYPYQSANGTYEIPAGAVVGVFSAATESGLIAAKLAVASTAAPTWVPPSEAPLYDRLTIAQVQAVQALVAAAWSPTDLLTGALQRVTITGAISTTGTQAAAASGTFYKARVAWNNNGASASAKLRIAVNCDNDVHGLMVGQSARRRNHEMTMGDAVILVCSVPITRLTFSADSSITAGTHQLQVTFGN